MTVRRTLCVAVALAGLAALSVCRAQSEPARTEIEAGAFPENLDNGYADWRAAYLFGERRIRPGQALYGQLRWTERFELDDSEAMIGYAHPFAQTWSGTLEASVSPEHRVLPRWSALGAIGKTLPRGVRVEAGFRRTEYTDTSTSLGTLTLERYFASFRAAYTLYLGGPEGEDPVATNRFALDWYYGERNSIGVSVALGQEAENVGPPRGVIVTNVRNAALIGRHWLDRSWALSYELLWQEQGSLYTRMGGRLGLRRAF